MVCGTEELGRYRGRVLITTTVSLTATTQPSRRCLPGASFRGKAAMSLTSF